METTIRDVLREKGDIVFRILPEEMVVSALRIMARHNIGALLVVDRSDQIVGIVTERDYSRKMILAGRTSASTRVSEIMERDVLYISPDDHVDDVMALMTEKRLRHLPVLQDGSLIGLISMGDVVKAAISHREFVIDQLGRYIAGSYAGNVVKFPERATNIDPRLFASNQSGS